MKHHLRISRSLSTGLLVATILCCSTAFGKIWGPLSLGMDRNTLDATLRSDPAFEPPGEMTVMGSSSENDRFVTRKTFYGDLCELSFRFGSDDLLNAVSFYSKTGFEPSLYNSRFKARYKNLFMSVSDRYGLPLNCPDWPSPERMKPNRVLFLHTWHIGTKESIMTGIMRDTENKCYVVTTFVSGKIRPPQNNPKAIKAWDAVPEFFDLIKADALNAKGMAALAAKNGKAAIPLFEEAAQFGSSRALWALGQIYAGGKGIPADKEKSQQYYRQAAEKGFALAAVLIDKNFDAAMKELEVFPEDAKALLSTCQRAASEGCVAEQFNIGIMYKNGYGLTKDPKKATRWLSAAAAKGDGQAAAALKTIK